MKDNFHLIFLVPCCILYKFVNFVQSSFLFRSSFIVCVYTLDFRLISYNSPIAMGSYQRALMILKMKSKSGFFREKLHVHYVDSKSRMEALSCQRFLTVCSQSLFLRPSIILATLLCKQNQLEQRDADTARHIVNTLLRCHLCPVHLPKFKSRNLELY